LHVLSKKLGRSELEAIADNLPSSISSGAFMMILTASLTSGSVLVTITLLVLRR